MVGVNMTHIGDVQAGRVPWSGRTCSVGYTGYSRLLRVDPPDDGGRLRGVEQRWQGFPPALSEVVGCLCHVGLPPLPLSRPRVSWSLLHVSIKCCMRVARESGRHEGAG